MDKPCTYDAVTELDTKQIQATNAALQRAHFTHEARKDVDNWTYKEAMLRPQHRPFSTMRLIKTCCHGLLQLVKIYYFPEATSRAVFKRATVLSYVTDFTPRVRLVWAGLG